MIRPIRVAIVDDLQLIVETLAAWVNGRSSKVEVVAAVTHWGELVRHPQHPADVVLLDLHLGDGIPLPVKISALRAAGSAVVVVSAFADVASVRSAIESGAMSFVSKQDTSGELLRAVQGAARGEAHVTNQIAYLLASSAEQGRPNLSSQEHRALCLYAAGLPMKSVARQMGVGFETAKSYVDRVRAKYEQAGRSVRTKLDLRLRAIEDGWLRVDDEL